VRCFTPEQLRATAEAIIEGAETFSTPEDDEVDIEAVHREGRVTYRMHRQRERDPRLRQRKITQPRRIAHDLACQACGSELRKVYGAPGDAVFECHHLVALRVSGETITTLD
jgi:5-methylcytosine-specific restriction protein A